MTQKGRVLVIEPKLALRAPLVHLFRKMGYGTDEAVGVTDALHAIGKAMPTCLVVAQDLRGDRGTDFVRAISGVRGLCNARVVLLVDDESLVPKSLLPEHVMLANKKAHGSLEMILAAILTAFKRAQPGGALNLDADTDLLDRGEEISAIDRALRMFDRVLDQIQNNRLPGPIMPSILMEVTRLVRDPGIDFQKIGNFVQQHQAIVTRLLALTNSAYYARGVAAKTAQQAVSRLGLQKTRSTLQALAMMSYVVGKQKELRTMLMDNLTRAYSVALFCDEIQAATRRKRSDELHEVGLLHNVGGTFFLYTVALLHERGETSDGDVDVQALQTMLDTKMRRLNSTVCRKLKLPRAVAEIFAAEADSLQENTKDATTLTVHQALWAVDQLKGQSDRKPEDRALELDSEAQLLGLNELVILSLNRKVSDLARAAAEYRKLIEAA